MFEAEFGGSRHAEPEQHRGPGFDQEARSCGEPGLRDPVARPRRQRARRGVPQSAAAKAHVRQQALRAIELVAGAAPRKIGRLLVEKCSVDGASASTSSAAAGKNRRASDSDKSRRVAVVHGRWSHDRAIGPTRLEQPDGDHQRCDRSTRFCNASMGSLWMAGRRARSAGGITPVPLVSNQPGVRPGQARQRSDRHRRRLQRPGGGA